MDELHSTEVESNPRDPVTSYLSGINANTTPFPPLYTLSERKKRAAEAPAYNWSVQYWPEIMRFARQTEHSTEGTGANLGGSG